MIFLSNGHQLDFVCGAGALGFDGNGYLWEKPLLWTGRIRPDQLTIVTKTVTLNKIKGFFQWHKPWRSVCLFRGGVVTAIGMTNRGFDWWVNKPYKRAMKKGYKIALSIQGTAEEVKIMAAKANSLNLAYVEMNLSCPNIDQSSSILSCKDILDAYAQVCQVPLVVKLSYDQCMDDQLLKLLDVHQAVEAVHAINAMSFHKVYPGEDSPLMETTGREGGVSGKSIFRYAMKAVQRVNERTTLPVIGGGGIASLQDVLMLEAVGSDAFSIGTLFLRCPLKPRKIINAYRAKTRWHNSFSAEVSVKKIDNSILDEILDELAGGKK